MNLLEETKIELKDFDKSPQDVLWCAVRGLGYFSWDDFVKVADFEYYEGFGAQEIANGLIIVFDGSWLERTEYDGQESWRHRFPPGKPEESIVPTKSTLLD